MLAFMIGSAVWLGKRPEIATPLTSHFRALDCVAMAKAGVSPYLGSVCHETPLALELMRAIDAVPYGKAAAWIMLDLCTAVLIGRIAMAEQRRRLRREAAALKALGEAEGVAAPSVAPLADAPTLIRQLDPELGATAAAFWLLNPFAASGVRRRKCSPLAMLLAAGFGTPAGLQWPPRFISTPPNPCPATAGAELRGDVDQCPPLYHHHGRAALCHGRGGARGVLLDRCGEPHSIVARYPLAAPGARQDIATKRPRLAARPRLRGAARLRLCGAPLFSGQLPWALPSAAAGSSRAMLR